MHLQVHTYTHMHTLMNKVRKCMQETTDIRT